MGTTSTAPTRTLAVFLLLLVLLALSITSRAFAPSPLLSSSSSATYQQHQQSCRVQLFPSSSIRRRGDAIHTLRRSGMIVVSASSSLASSIKGQQQQTDVLIVGAGIAGIALAADLERRGINYLVVEKASSPREGGTAIGLWSQAWRCLDNLGIAEPLRKNYYEGSGIRIASSKKGLLKKKEGEVDSLTLKSFSLQDCDYGPHEFRYVMRSELLALLLKQVPSQKILYNFNVVRFDEIAGEVVVELGGGKRIKAQVLVGADGVGSTIYKQLYPGVPLAKYAGYKAIRGIARLDPKKRIDTTGLLPFGKGTINQIWGQGVRLGTFRMSANTLYWFVTYNAPKDEPNDDPSGEALLTRSRKELAGWDERWGVNVILDNTSPSDVLRTSIGDRFPKLSNWGKGRVTMIGDSAHPATPNLGQGGAAAIEDALVLGEALSTYFNPITTLERKEKEKEGQEGEIASILRTFEKERGPRVAKLVLKAGIFGLLLQIPFSPITFVRDNIALPLVFKPASFLEHTKFTPPAVPAVKKRRKVSPTIGWWTR